MLTALRFHNFRTFLNAELQLAGRHLLIGRNNSGKTNLARAIRFLGATSAMELGPALSIIPGGIWELRNWYLRSDVVQLSCDCRLESPEGRHEFSYELNLAVEQDATGQGELRVAKEQLLLKCSGSESTTLLTSDGRQATVLHEANAPRGREPRYLTALAPRNATMLSKLYELETNRRAILFRNFMAGWAYYALNPEAMRNGWQNPAGIYSLSPNGDNLAHVIYQLKNQDELRYRRLIDHVRVVEPDLQAVNFATVPGQMPVPFVALTGRPQASWLGLSDGTLRALALACIVELSAGSEGWQHPLASPRLSIIEEPENGIAPAYLRAMFDWFEERAPQSQFVFTSHSPYFIDMFDSSRDAVTLLKRAADRTEFRTPLPPQETDAPDRLSLADEYATELIG